MEIVRPEFVPDPSLARDEMAALQRDIAEAAVFEDDISFDVASLRIDSDQRTLGDAGTTDATPLVAGVDQAFVGDRAVSAVVVLRDGEVVDEVTAVEPVTVPYIPGLLAFREGGVILAAFEKLTSSPDVVLVDGSGRIHYREAGLATHIGVALDVPTVGVAKNLLCGAPRASLDRKLPVGERIGIEADADVETAPDGTLIGYAVQTRQYDSPNRHINPLIVSPGHRVSAATAADVVAATVTDYKLPEPTRLADRAADAAKDAVEST
ncbi:endonuclease V [Halomicroarcula sp. GCM10025324]|uniref:endonuclease V n=1 Tax=Haloarcula TaxID=2237 RepID=UPI0023E7C1D3|nr:endonuclease V [Halomicroarcula sp. ZS-22-S1]